MGYTSKFTGAEIDNLLSKVQEGGSESGGGIEVYDLNIELEEQYEKFFLGKESTFNKNYEPLPSMMMGEGSFPLNSFVNVLINGKKFYSGVAQQVYIEGREAAAVAPLSVKEIMGAISNYEISPSLIPVSVEGVGVLIMILLPHESSASIAGLTVVSQDTINLQTAYNNAQSPSDLAPVTLNYRMSHIQSTSFITSFIRTTFGYGGESNGIKEFYSADLLLSILVDSTGTITEVISKDPIYNSLLDRIKALENGN